MLKARHRHEAHARPRHRLAGRLGVVAVVLVALPVGRHELQTISHTTRQDRPTQVVP